MELAGVAMGLVGVDIVLPGVAIGLVGVDIVLAGVDMGLLEEGNFWENSA